MKVSEMPEYAKRNKPLGIAFLFCCVCLVLLFVQFILFDKSSKDYYIKVIFLFLIPALAAVCFAFHCITMTEDRPTMLTMMPLTYFLSLLINELVAIEANTFQIKQFDTYPYIPMLETVPFIFYAITVATKKFKKPAIIILRIWIVFTYAASAVITVISVFFNVRITHSYNYIMTTFSIVTGFVAVGFMYMAMLETLKLAGRRVEGTPWLTNRKKYLETTSAPSTEDSASEEA